MNDGDDEDPRSGGAQERAAPAAPLADAIDARSDAIAARWLARVATLPLPRPLSREELLDSLPALLRALTALLRQLPGSDARSALEGAELGATHGEQRVRLGFSLELVVAEYLALRDELLDEVQGCGLPVAAGHLRAVADFVMLALAKAAEAHARCRERAAQREAADRRHEAELPLRQLFAIMPFYAALARGPDHVMELVTEPLKALWGGRDPIGRPHRDAYPELGPEHFVHWDEVYATGEPFRGSGIKALVDRGLGRLEELCFDLLLLPRRRADGSVEGVAAFAIDITERVRIEEELRRRIALEQQLVGIVSHDLRSPLAAVLFGTHALLRRTDLSEVAVRTVLRIQSSAEGAERLVRDLLDFTQARLGEGIPIRRIPLDLHELSLRVVQELQMSHPTRLLHLRAEGDGWGHWDPDRMAQVIANLVSNALKYSPEESPVTVTTRQRDGAVEIAVHNLGPSIPPEVRPRLFEPLQRGSAEPGEGGRSIGLGLYIVKHLVEAHAGQIALTSSEAEGTTFTVLVPKDPPAP